MLRKDTIKLGATRRDTASPAEIAKFNALADEWWNPAGKFKVVHAFNAARVDYLIPHIALELGLDNGRERSLAGLRIADVGCGAGLVSEPLARAGAHVFAIDAAERNVSIARHHATASGVDTIVYETALPEDVGAEHHGAYDAVLSLEVVEHVGDLSAFLAAISRLVRPGGILIIGTLNRTPKSFVFGIVGAEYVLRLLPIGTHVWRSFVKPEELDAELQSHALKRTSVTGVSMNPITWNWSIGRDINVNYLATFRKSG